MAYGVAVGLGDRIWLQGSLVVLRVYGWPLEVASGRMGSTVASVGEVCPRDVASGLKGSQETSRSCGQPRGSVGDLEGVAGDLRSGTGGLQGYRWPLVVAGGSRDRWGP